jgi:hypothetical protein
MLVRIEPLKSFIAARPWLRFYRHDNYSDVAGYPALRSGAAELGVRLFERGTLVTSAKKKSSSENRTFKLEGWLPIALFAGLIFIGFIAALIIPSTS